jgi:hypothetical protein
MFMNENKLGEDGILPLNHWDRMGALLVEALYFQGPYDGVFIRFALVLLLNL